MNLDGLRREAQRRLGRIERAVTFDVLAADQRRADRRRDRCLSKIDVSAYLHPGEVVRLHRSLLPQKDDRYWGGSSGANLRWAEWTPLVVDRIGDCVRLFVPGHGSMAWPAGDFVRGVLAGHVTEAP